MADTRTKILQAALRNALFHGGEARVEPVMAKVMGENPELREDVENVRERVKHVVKDVNQMGVDAQREEAAKLGVSLERDSEPEEEGLPELEGARQGEVITRFAPNPNGPLHLGSARALVLSGAYADEYDGRLILRFDDTDPKNKRPVPEAYDWIREDMEWLGFEPDVTIHASERMDAYYSAAVDLIRKGEAYVCTCEPEDWKEMRDGKEACPCRKLNSGENEDRWHDMLNGHFREGEAVVRIETDMSHKNPAIRDWPALRIIEDADHPRVGDEYNVWPLYNFASAIDDHEFGVTHIFRGQEHTTNTEKQEYLYGHMGWEMPEVIHHGRLGVKDMILSTSTIRSGIEDGKYDGWDDPRLGTLRALRRRGFRPETVRHLIEHMGINPSDSEVSTENMAAENRNHIDFTSNRYYFVRDPVEFAIEGGEKSEAKIPLHPDDESRGHRELEVGDRVLLDREDVRELDGETIRLKGLFNVEMDADEETLTYAGNEIVQEMPKIQWAPPEMGIDCSIVMDDAKEREGKAEENVLDETVGDVIQFERFGFVRIDSKDPLTCYFAHR